MSDRPYFAPWRVLKPSVFVSFLLVWNGIFLLAHIHERRSGMGAFKTPESNLLVVAAFALTLLAVLALLLSTRVREAVVREGTDIEPYRPNLWLIVAVLLALVVGFSIQARSASSRGAERVPATVT